MGVSVTQRINQISQPRGGYINPKLLTVNKYEDANELSDDENIHASLIGLAVDYLTRFNNGTPPEEAFRISVLGAGIIGETKNANKLLVGIKGIDDNSIINACKLSGYDVCFRAGPMGYRPVNEILPNESTIQNIRIMVERSQSFLKIYPVILDGFTFEGGYTETISAGDGDFLSADTLWDFKVSKKPPTNKHTLQLLIYWIMGKHSMHREFDGITNLGIFNPRLNTSYCLPLQNIEQEIISTIERDVICY
jgi:hypothetical protein